MEIDPNIETARHPSTPIEAKLSEGYLVFGLGAHWYAFPSARVQRVLPPSTVALVPGMPALVVGVINYAGKIVAVLRLHSLIGTSPSPRSSISGRLLVLNAKQGLVAVEVDEVLGIQDVEAAQRVVPGDQQEFRRTVVLGERAITLLELESLLSAAVSAIRR